MIEIILIPIPIMIFKPWLRTVKCWLLIFKRREGIQFLPVVVETLGGWQEGAVKQVKKLAAARARHSIQEEEAL